MPVAISKSLRFDIFRRDKFTCQYCGRQPPDVILEADHITPMSKGGGDEPENLVTSCFECNRGKGTKLLKTMPSIQDLDLDYFEAEQRLAKLQRYKKIKTRLDKALAETISSLQEFFRQQVGTDWAPELQDLRWPLYYHDPDEIENAIVLASGQSKSYSPIGKWQYACAILRNWRNNSEG